MYNDYAYTVPTPQEKACSEPCLAIIVMQINTMNRPLQLIPEGRCFYQSVLDFEIPAENCAQVYANA